LLVYIPIVEWCVFVKRYCTFAILECLHYSPLHKTTPARVVLCSVEGEVVYFTASGQIRKTTVESGY